MQSGGVINLSHISFLFAIILGEMARVYSKDELTTVLTNIQITGTMMYGLAPCSPVFFANIDFVMFGLKINQYNCVALIVLVVLVLFGIFSYFFLTNLTRHPGYKIYIERIHPNEITDDIKICNSGKAVQLLSLKDILSDFDLITILAGATLTAFIYGLGEVTINMVAMLQFKWTLTRVSVVTLCTVVATTVLMILLQRFKGSVNTFYLNQLCTTFNWMFMALLLFTRNTKVDSYTSQVVIFFTFLMLNLVAGYNSTAWARWLYFSIIPHHSCSTVDGFRFTTTQIGCSFGFLLASFAYKEHGTAYTIIAVLCILEYICLLFSRKRFVSS